VIEAIRDEQGKLIGFARSLATSPSAVKPR
jgi:hypothetical protein